jgi:hypothetical protein
MLEIADVSRAVVAYRSGETSLGQFADWLRAVSRQKFAESEEVRNAILEIDSLLSEVDYGGMSEVDFRKELANAARPFVPREHPTIAVYDERPREQRAASFAVAAAAVVLCMPSAHVTLLNVVNVVGRSSVVANDASESVVPVSLAHAES